MLRVLFVDDESLGRDMLRHSLDWTALGFHIVGEAHNAHEALTLVKQTYPDLVFTDICMPKTDGIELAAMIKSFRPATRVVAVTGFAEFDYAKRLMRIGVMDYLLKPVDWRELKDVSLRIQREVQGDVAAHRPGANGPNLGSADAPVALAEAVAAGNVGAAVDQLHRLVEDRAAADQTTTTPYVAYCEIIAILRDALVDLALPLERFFGDRSPFEIALGGDEPQAIASQLERTVIDVVSGIRESHNGGDRFPKIDSFLRSQLAQGALSLADVASHAKVSPNYVSTVLKDRTGLSFVTYLSRLRIEEALRLMKETNLKAWEIGERIGIADAHYFSIFFRRLTGTSFAEYKRRLLR